MNGENGRRDDWAKEAIELHIEMCADRRCDLCGGGIDVDLLQSCLESLATEANARGMAITRAALHLELEPLCPDCLSRRAARTQSTLSHGASSLHLRELHSRRQNELRDYFKTAPAQIIGNPKMREPQIEAYRALTKYFASGEQGEKNLPAIVEIPTGCGKTGIICTVPFGLAQGRVLIIAPNLTIKKGVVKSLGIDTNLPPDAQTSRDNFYLKCRVFEEAKWLPRFAVLERGQVNREDCLRADIIVCNIQQIQSWLEDFEDDFFDLIIVDEAHHEPADSWQRVNDRFARAKKIYLTATPFRCDNKPIIGETLYRYRLGQAIANKYVKNVLKMDAIATQMTFTVCDESRELSYDEIMMMREEAWFSRGVALSPLCNATIIDRTIAIWQHKKQSGIAHKIIGAACSIRHAEQIVAQYLERGIKATHVASEGMTLEERGERLNGFERGNYDCIVHVGILGEGYDHPDISIAAIFRPFRSLSPYAQFIGRAIRWIYAGNDKDNLAHVVSHAGLNLNFLWEYFKHETREAAILSYVDQLFFNPDFEEESEAGERGEGEDLDGEVTREEIEGFDVDSFLPVAPDTKYFGPVTSRANAFAATMRGAGFRDYGRSQEQSSRAQTLRERTPRAGQSTLHDAPLVEHSRRRKSNEKSLELPFHRPDLERRLFRQNLNKDVQRAAGWILWMLKLPPDNSRVALIENLSRDQPAAEIPNTRTNYEAVVSALHRALNRASGKDETASNRNDWTLHELRVARGLVNETRAQLIRDIRRAIAEEHQQRLPFDAD